jgi:hypothetical protein
MENRTNIYMSSKKTQGKMCSVVVVKFIFCKTIKKEQNNECHITEAHSSTATLWHILDSIRTKIITSTVLTVLENRFNKLIQNKKHDQKPD